MTYFDRSADWRTVRRHGLHVATSLNTSLEPAERNVLTLARRDRLSSLARASRWRRLIARLFGFAPINALADPRLEALRRYAVLARRAPERIGAEAVSELANAGYGAQQITEIQNAIDLDIAERDEVVLSGRSIIVERSYQIA